MGEHGIKRLLKPGSPVLLLCIFVIGIVGFTRAHINGGARGNSEIHPDFSGGERVTAQVFREVIENSQNVRASRHLTNRNRRRDKRHVPVLSTKNSDGGHHERLKLELPLDSVHHVLDLQLNRDLITKGYFQKYQAGTKHVIQKPSFEEAELCHYHGKIRNRPNSWAALSTCDGISGVVFDGQDLHYLEPHRDELLASEVDSAGGEKWTVLNFKHSNYKKNFTCGHDEHNDVLPGFGNFALLDSNKTEEHSRIKRGLSDHDDTRVPYNSNAKSRYVEMVIVVDNKKYKELGGDLKKTFRRTKDIANIVNALYQPFNVFIALVGVVVWSEADEITIKTNGDETLSSFLHYRRERLVKDHPNDNAQLLTAVEFENGVVGKAMQGPICSYKYSGGVNSDSRNHLVGIVATTVAHELGHNFGLAHDRDECHCSAPGNRCIMAASASSNQTSQWSSCSLKDMAYAFDHGMDYCLRNKPKSLFDGPTCGNGFTEPGEECDCGLAEHCDNPCCDASTCLIHLNATCASGTCCDMNTCHVKSGGTPCRETTGLCDLPEFCTGESEFCPQDVHKLDGLQCKTSTGEAYCYNGECRTHTDQCKLLWGPSGNNSDDLCYQRNANGTRVAHCGYDLMTETYAQCKQEDSKCGVLHCQMNNEKLEFGYETAAILSSFFVNAGGKIFPCRSVTVDFGLQDVNPGMVPDGAKCGTDKMCVNQKCVAVKSIVGSFDSGCADCSGHGVCNSKGHCHCDDSYGGHLCEGSGYGGSVDSGPALHRGTSRIAKALYVTFFGFIPLIAIITFYIYYANDYLKKLCMEVRRGGLRSVTHPQPRGPKPTTNGNTGGRGPRSPDSSNSTQPQGQGSGQSPSGDPDFFGNYKGFSLSPIKSSPQLQRNGSATSNVSNGSIPSPRGAVNNNNIVQNNQSPIPNGHIQSKTNDNVYYSPVARVENETLVRNSSEKTSTLKSPHQTSFLNKGNPRVSWAQPIASRLPVSPPSPSEDESANSDTPLYEGSEGGNSSPRIVGPHNQRYNNSQTSPSPVMMNGQNELNGAIHSAPNVPLPPVKKESGFARIAAAFPNFRNSLRSSSSPDGKHGLKNGSKREHLEISKPILQGEFDQNKIQHCVPITPSDEQPRYANFFPGDQVDGSNGGKGRYANAPSPVLNQNPGKPALKNHKVKGSTPPPEPTQNKPIPKVQRAHSMIQPSTSNRNSVGSNPNYNSLRRSRPTAPPPKPPECAPPPPPVPTSFSSRTNFFKSSTPPLYNSPSVGSPTSVRNSILKFTFGGRNPGSNGFLGSRGLGLGSKPVPIAKVEEPVSPTPELPPSPPPITNKEDNIYDTIDEGIPPHFEHFERKADLASSEESSPKKSPENSLEEKIDTLSTGSSENGGLLSEIISEIKCRNKESIYNSVDRKRQKAKKKAAALAAAAAAEKALADSKGRTPSPAAPSFQKPPPIKSASSSNPREFSGRSYEPPKAPYSISSKANSPLPVITSNNKPKPITEKPRITLNPNVGALSKTPPNRPSSSPGQSSFAPLINSSMTSSKSVTPPPRPTSPAVAPNSNSSAPKPTCAVNGIPKALNGITQITTGPINSNSASASNLTNSPNSCYVAKINYFSNLGGSSNSPTLMKPISSLPAPSPGNAAKEIIYAPSSVGVNSDGERSHLSTIRRSRGSYLANKERESFENSEDEKNDNRSSGGSNTGNYNNYPNNFAKKPGGGIYASLGRKVPTPVIRSNSLEKEKLEARRRDEVPSSTGQKVIEKVIPVDEKESPKPEQVGGYKPFNPYLNRPLTFSTFRPNNATASSVNANSALQPATKTSLTLSGSNKPVTLNTYSISNNKTASPLGLGVTSPIQIRTNRS